MISNTTQIYIKDKGYADVSDSMPFALNYNVVDIRDITLRRGYSSKTLALPGTPNNALLFGQLFNIRAVDMTFDLNKKYEVNVLKNGLIIFDGYLTLKDIVKNSNNNIYNEDTDILYNVVLYNKAVDLFTIIDPLNLDDIDFKVSTHTLSQSDITSSFAHTWLDTYKYFCFDNGSSEYLPTDFWPSIYVKQYINRIIGDAGYHYEPTESTFMTGSPMENLVIPYTGNINMKDATLWARERFYGAKTGTTTYTRTLANKNILELVEFNDYTTFPYFVNQYDEPVMDTYTANLGGQQDFLLKFTGRAIFTATEDLWYGDMVGTYVTTPKTRSRVIPMRAVAYVNDVYKSSSVNFTTGILLPVNDTFVFSSYTVPDMVAGTVYSQNFEFIISLKDIALLAGDELTIKLSSNLFRTDVLWYNQAPSFLTPGQHWTFGSLTPSTNASVQFSITEVQWYNNPQGTTTRSPGDPVDINDYIPKNVKQSEFLGNIMKMFNLVLDSDINNTNRLIIKTRDNYYSTPVYKDWTEKVDKSKEIKVTYLPELQKRNIELTYRKADNSYSKQYTDYYNEVYGNKKVVFSTETVTGTDKKEFMFADCPVVQNVNLKVPAINSKDPKNLHVLYDGGMKQGNWGIYSANYTTYPYAGHWDDPYTPEIDLNFGYNKAYFTDGQYTENNLFNIYHYNTFKQISEQRMVSMYMVLNEDDIAQLRLSDKIVIDNTVYIINAVIDYNPTVKESCRVEFILWDTIYSETPSYRKPIWGGSITPSLPNVVYPAVIKPNKPIAIINDVNVNVISPGAINTYISGRGNTIEDTTNSFVHGNSNRVFGGDKIFLWGMDNTEIGAPLGVNPDGTITGGSLVNVYAFGETLPFEPTSNNFYVGTGITLNAGTAQLENLSVTGIAQLDNLSVGTISGETVMTPIYLTYSGTSGTTSGTLGCTLTSPGHWTVTQFNAHYYIDDKDGNIEITIPDADITNKGKTIQFSKPRLVASDNSITIVTVGGQNIAQTSTYEIKTSDSRVEFISNRFGGSGGVEWKYRVTLGAAMVEPYVLRVGQYSTLFKTPKEAVDFANDYARQECLILIEPGQYIIDKTIEVKTKMKIMGRGSEITTLIASPKLTGRSMFLVYDEETQFDSMTLSGSNLTYAGIEFSGTPYSEIRTLVLDNCERGICFAIEGTELWAIDSIIKNNDIAGICNLGGASVGVSEMTFENNFYGINFWTGDTQRHSVQNSIFLVNTGQTGIQWATNQNTYEYAFFSNNAFYGEGTYINGFTWSAAKDADIVIQNNVGIDDYKPEHWLWVDANTTQITLADVNTYYPYTIDPEKVVEFEYIKFSGDGATIATKFLGDGATITTTYIASLTRRMMLTITGEVQAGTDAQNLNVALFKNGEKYHNQTIRCATQNTPYPFVLTGILRKVSQGDVFDLRVSNETSERNTSILSSLYFNINAL